MAKRERLRRPVLERTKPHRNWNTVVSAAPATERHVGADVQDANRVLDEHLRAGEASARLFPTAQATGLAGGDSQDIAQRMLRAASDLMSFWFDFMSRAAGSFPAADRMASAPPSPPPPADAARGEPPPVAVEVDSARPVRVTVQLRPDARSSTLTLDRLHPRRHEAPPLTGLRIDPPDDGNGVVIRLRIDPTHPAGVYDGVVLDDATSLPVGTISVDLQSRRGPRPTTTRRR